MRVQTDLLNDFDYYFFIFFSRRSTYYGSESTGDPTLFADDLSHIFRCHLQLNRNALFLFSFSYKTASGLSTSDFAIASTNCTTLLTTTLILRFRIF